MKVLIDTNVILDMLLRRDPFYGDSCAVFDLVEQRRFIACVSSSAATDIFYFLFKAHKDVDKVYASMDDLASMLTIAPVLESTIKSALALRWKDFEGAVQYVTAWENGADCVITRNAADFELSAVPCISPADFLAHFAFTGEGPSR